MVAPIIPDHFKEFLRWRRPFMGILRPVRRPTPPTPITMPMPMPPVPVPMPPAPESDFDLNTVSRGEQSVALLQRVEIAVEVVDMLQSTTVRQWYQVRAAPWPPRVCM